MAVKVHMGSNNSYGKRATNVKKTTLKKTNTSISAKKVASGASSTYVIIFAIIFLCALIIFLLNRSKGMSYIGENEQMERVKISFMMDEKESRRIVYDFLEHTITYGNKESVKCDIGMENKIKELLRKIDFSSSYSLKTAEDDEQKRLWSVRVWTDEKLYHCSGFEGEEYPDYWNDLMNLLGETDYLQNTNT